MSAYLVSHAHIDALVEMATRYRPGQHWPFSYFHAGQWHRVYQGVNNGAQNNLGRILWTANLASVAARYPEDTSGTRPGPNGLTDQDIIEYEYDMPAKTYSPVAILKAICGYEYQSCEHEGWETSEAHAITAALRDQCIERLPGYEEADWTID